MSNIKAVGASFVIVDASRRSNDENEHMMGLLLLVRMSIDLDLLNPVIRC